MQCTVFLLILTNTCSAHIQHITSILGEPFLMLKANQTNVNAYQGNEKYEGFSKDLADMLATRLNFSYTLSLVRDGKYGRLLTNGTWNGIIGELLDDMDMSIAPITITRERKVVVDFSTPFIEFQLAILLRKEELRSNLLTYRVTSESETPTFFNQSLLLRPVTPALWTVLSVTILCLLFMSFLIEFLITRKQKPFSKISHAGTGLQLIFRSYIIVFLVAYVGSFVSRRVIDRFGTEDETSLNIKSISDLAAQEHSRYGVIRAGSTYDYFRVSQDRNHRKMYSVMTMDKVTTLPLTIEEGVARVRDGIQPYAFILEAPYAKYQTTLKPCNVAVAPEYFGPKRAFAIATKPNHTLKTAIDTAILTMKENGDMEELEAKWFQSNDDCQTETGKNVDIEHKAQELNLEDLAVIFSIFPIVSLVALIIAVIELCIIKTKHHTRHK